MRHHKLIRLAAILLILIMYATTAKAGVIAWYPLHGNANAVIGNDGMLVNSPTPAPDQNGNANGALSFQGVATNMEGNGTACNGSYVTDNNSGSYVSVAGGAGLPGLEEFSIAMWVSWNGMQTGGWSSPPVNYGTVIARQGNGKYSNNVLGISDPDPTVGTLTWRPYGAGAPLATGVTPVGDSVWHFVAVAVDGSTGEQDVYLDGNLEDTGYATTGANNCGVYTLNADTTSPLTIGAWIGDGGTYSTSTIHDVYLFDSYLSQAELQALQMTGVPYQCP
jgi:hypothetical protein